ncbi:hypothetical protein E1297_02180 [Roseibium sp. RKSG952]|nr:hypothetical protein [Roseibium sp. RKSG952]
MTTDVASPASDQNFHLFPAQPSQYFAICSACGSCSATLYGIILVEAPGEDDPERLKDLVGQTAQLTFHRHCHLRTAPVLEEFS